MKFFTSDTHFGHANIINHSERPFRDVAQMDDALIKNWNAFIKPDDDVYHLGDFCWGTRRAWAARARQYREQLNGRIHLITGNHDPLPGNARQAEIFESVQDYLVLNDNTINGGNTPIVLFHYAMRTWDGSHWGSWHLYGHSHGKLPDNPLARAFDIGVDCHNYYPLSLQQVREKMMGKILAMDNPQSRGSDIPGWGQVL